MSFKNLCCSLFALLLLSGCNIFSWTYSEEDTTSLAVALAGADAAFADRDYDKAILLYENAGLLAPGDAWSRHRLLQCLLLRNSGGNSLFTTHARLFTPPLYTNTEPPYADWAPVAAYRLAEDTRRAGAILAERRTNSGLTWSRLSADDPSVLADAALTEALLGILLLQDGNGNLQLLEATDPGSLDGTFFYTMTNTLSPAAETNLCLHLAAATNALHNARASLTNLFARAPEASLPGSVWQNLYTNLAPAISSSAAVITTLGALP